MMRKRECQKKNRTWLWDGEKNLAHNDARKKLPVSSKSTPPPKKKVKWSAPNL
jgi:hypothetical protein